MRTLSTILICALIHSRESPVSRAQQGQPTFRLNVDLVTTDVIVRDQRGQFIADLKSGELEVYEDGVKQDIASLTMIHGGRQYNVQSLPAPAREGLIVPPSRPTNDTA